VLVCVGWGGCSAVARVVCLCVARVELQGRRRVADDLHSDDESLRRGDDVSDLTARQSALQMQTTCFCTAFSWRLKKFFYINLFSQRNASDTKKTQRHKITSININKTKAATKSIISK